MRGLLMPVIAFVLILLTAAGQCETAPRAVALAPHLAELAYAAGVGDHLVGTVAWSDYPAAARELPGIGDAYRVDMEMVLRLEASHALAWRGGTPPAAAARLEALGIELLWVETRTVDDIAVALAEIGAWLGRPSAARAAADDFIRRLDRARKAAPAEADLAVFFQVSARPLFTLGGRHVINDVLGMCGASNVFSELDTEAAAVDLEAVLAADPDVIIAGREPGAGDVLSMWRERAYNRASRCGRLIEFEADLLVRPTPRILDGVAELCAKLERIRRASSRGCGNDPG